MHYSFHEVKSLCDILPVKESIKKNMNIFFVKLPYLKNKVFDDNFYRCRIGYYTNIVSSYSHFRTTRFAA